MVGPETGAVPPTLDPQAGASSLHGKQVQHLLQHKQWELREVALSEEQSSSFKEDPGG